MSHCPACRWRWEPCTWRSDAYVVRCEDCGHASHVVTLRFRGCAVQFTYEPYREEP